MNLHSLPTNSISGNLIHNTLLFGRLLRGLGLDVNTGQLIDFVYALDYIEIGRKRDFYYAARSLFVHQQAELPLFDQAFKLFWRKPIGAEPPAEWSKLAAPRRNTRRAGFPAPAARQLKISTETNLHDNSVNEEPFVEVTQTYSAREVLRHKDFAGLTADELADIKQMLSALTWNLGKRRTRRRQPGRGQLFDLRRTVRNSLRYGGEALEWTQREPKFKPRPLVILADISGSMERYTRLLLHFIYGLTAGLDQSVESFVFGTQLTRITRQLRTHDVDVALREVSHRVADWSGGTRIGAALKTFNFDWARRVLGRGAIVLLISDGWDRGDVDQLRREIARLQRACHRLIWLNPLLGSPDYQPLTRGMQTALPYIDDFLPVHNLASLEDLAHRLADLDVRSPIRRQSPLTV